MSRKPSRGVEALGAGHEGEGVEDGAAVAEPPGLGDDGGGEAGAEAGAAGGGGDVEALDFAGGGVEPAQRDGAGGRVAGAEGEEERAARRGVAAGPGGELGVDALEGEADAVGVGEPVGIGADEAAGGFDPARAWWPGRWRGSWAVLCGQARDGFNGCRGAWRLC